MVVLAANEIVADVAASASVVAPTHLIAEMRLRRFDVTVCCLAESITNLPFAGGPTQVDTDDRHNLPVVGKLFSA
jgi:hypothetical protein